MPYKCTFTYTESIQCTYYTALPVYLMNNEYGYYICKQRHKNYASRKSAVLIHYDIACRTCDTDVIRSFHKRCEVGQIKVESRIEQFSDIAFKLVYTVCKLTRSVLCVFRSVCKLFSAVLSVFCAIGKLLCSVYRIGCACQ